MYSGMQKERKHTLSLFNPPPRTPVKAKILFNTGHSAPQNFKRSVVNRANPPVRQMKHAAMKHPAQTHIHACRHDRPLPVMGVEAITIQVLMSTEPAIRKKTKFQKTPFAA
jgi:hypothetical protein